jgi:hypothetical protein
MWEPQPLITLRASKACRRENFTFTFCAEVVDVQFWTSEEGERSPMKPLPGNDMEAVTVDCKL